MLEVGWVVPEEVTDVRSGAEVKGSCELHSVDAGDQKSYLEESSACP